jgi:hypothetical protein
MESDESAARFSLRVSRVTRSHGSDEYRLRVTDQSSRLPVVELSLTAEQFAEAVTGMGAADVLGEIPAPAVRDRLGKQMDHYSVVLKSASEEQAAEWGAKARHVLGAETVDVTRVQGGKQVTFRWYRPVGSPPIDHVVAASLLPPRPTA